MRTREQTVHRYMEGFRHSDHEADDVIVITGTGHGRHREHGGFRFAYSDLFTFRGELIARVDSYVVPLSEGAPAAG